MASMERYGINISTLVTWFLLFLTMIFNIYGFYFKVETHINDEIAHVTKAEMKYLEDHILKLELEQKNLDLKTKEIVRQTIRELKSDGFIK